MPPISGAIFAGGALGAVVGAFAAEVASALLRALL